MQHSRPFRLGKDGTDPHCADVLDARHLPDRDVRRRLSASAKHTSAHARNPNS